MSSIERTPTRKWPINRGRLGGSYVAVSIESENYRRQRLEENLRNASENKRWIEKLRDLFVKEFSEEPQIIDLFTVVFESWGKCRFMRNFKHAPDDVLRKLQESGCSSEVISRFEAVQKTYSLEIIKEQLKVELQSRKNK